ncbi:MAG: dUTP diphosphatase [Oscillospiraceae bacterium]|nr:dUTP diphosphatase [Oscillospiraceae bacterium]
MDILKIQKLDPKAIAPVKATIGSACFDLHALLEEAYVLQPGDHHLFHTGLSIEMPTDDCVCLLFSRSGMGVKHGVTLSNSVGVIDSDYRGELCVALVNHGDEPYTVEPEDRIAQMMVIKTIPLEIAVVEALNETERGTGGFGSTGSK